MYERKGRYSGCGRRAGGIVGGGERAGEERPSGSSSGKTNLKHAENVDNYLGFYKITGGELMDRFEEHAAALGISAEKGKVLNVMPLGGYFMLNFAGQIVEASAVVLAIGTAKAREIAGEGRFLRRGVSYCACDGMLYRGRKAVVWGLARFGGGEQISFTASEYRSSLPQKGGGLRI